MLAEDCLSSGMVRRADLDDAFKASRPQGSAVDRLQAVAGRNDNDAVTLFRPIHQLKQAGDHLGRVFWRMTRKHLPVPHAIKLIQEQDRRRVVSGFAERFINAFQHIAEMPKRLGR